MSLNIIEKINIYERSVKKSNEYERFQFGMSTLKGYTNYVN